MAFIENNCQSRLPSFPANQWSWQTVLGAISSNKSCRGWSRQEEKRGERRREKRREKRGKSRSEGI